MPRSEDKRALTSLRIFRTFIDRNGAEYDARRIISRECYEMWLGSRKSHPPQPEKSFQRALTAHIGGIDGRTPFTKAEEDAVLKVLRTKQKWPCFEGSKTKFGIMGFRTKGYHERRTEQNDSSATPFEDSHSESNENSDEFVLSSDVFDDEEEENVKVISKKRRPQNGSPQLATSKKPRSDDELSDYSKVAHDVITAIDDEYDLASRDPYISWFLGRARDMLFRFHQTSHESWDRFLSAMRYTIMARGTFYAGDDAAIDRVFEQAVAEHPDRVVFIIDILSKSPRERVVRLNDLGRKFLGPITRNENGITTRIVHPSSILSMFKITMKICANPGKVVEGDLHVVDKNGVIRRAHIWVQALPELRAVLTTARALD